jgi:perosamine synthetase
MLHLYSHARTALKYGLQAIGLKAGDTILVPEYICDVLLHPMNQMGIKYAYYPINDALSPMWEDMDDLVGLGTKAIIMVHYFGQPQNIRDFQSFSNDHSLLLIEDNAHGAGGRLNNQLLGTFGDVGISSEYKTLNLFCGSGLWLKNGDYETIAELKQYPVPLFQRIIKNSYISRSKIKSIVKKYLVARPKYENPREFRELTLPDYSIDNISGKIIGETNWEDLISSRQKLYNYWLDYAVSNNLTPVFDKLNSTANPWCFPAYVASRKEAVKWFDWGWENDVKVTSWPSLPEDILSKQGTSFHRWEKLICFGLSKRSG